MTKDIDFLDGDVRKIKEVDFFNGDIKKITKELDWFEKPKEGCINKIVNRVDRRMETEKGKVGAKLP